MTKGEKFSGILLLVAVGFALGFIFGATFAENSNSKKPSFHDGVRAAVKGEWTAIKLPDGNWVTSKIPDLVPVK